MSKDHAVVYKKMTHHEHILKLPDTYIGSVKTERADLWIIDNETKKLIKKEITYVPGLYKIYDEILVNAHDHTRRESTCKTIKITITQDTGEITIWNDGRGIDVSINEKEKIYNPELIFGYLLTSSNYDQEGKIWGGKNGYGAKLTNIYSSHFYVETVDDINHKKFYQHFYENMYKRDKAVITSVSSSVKPYTKITFIPDFQRFGMEGLTDDLIGLFKKRAYDIAACGCGRVKVYLNDELIQINSFGDYIRMHFPNPDVQMTYREINDCWKVGIVYTPNSGFSHVSHVNGIWTYSREGGTHVRYVTDRLMSGLVEYVKSKNKGINIRPSYIKENMTIFIDCTTKDPDFSSQSKDCLTTKSSAFLKECVIDASFVTAVSKLDIVKDAINFTQLKEALELKKTDGKKTTKTIHDIDKLFDAKHAGKKDSWKCKLIITEGDSAASFAMNGLRVIGDDYYGVFPIRGKMLNVRDTSIKRIADNAEITNLKKIIGLQTGIKYNKETVKKLRYGGILVLTDADVDGSHIKGLVMNFIQFFWPELMLIDGFFQTMATPIVKATRRGKSSDKKQKIFYTLSEYNNWAKDIGTDIHHWSIKYYKGLGTSTTQEAIHAFDDFDKKLMSYIWEQTDKISKTDKSGDDIKTEKSKVLDKHKMSDVSETSHISKKSETHDNVSETEQSNLNGKSYDAIVLAFSKKLADKRKDWLRNYDKDIIVEPKDNTITYSDFVNKDLIHFSNYDNIRSIPSMCDGLKPSQRKILFTTMDKKIDSPDKEQKVQGLGSIVQSRTKYIHGETSLFEAIIKMAQNFVGSNNINLLYPNGSFGSRRLGGEDAAAPRYIYTYLESITKLIFRKEDEPIYKYLVEENIIIEPEHMAPIIPMILVNGTQGIGTGYSSFVPCHNPRDIIKNIIRSIDGKDIISMTPWYKGFNGDITPKDTNEYAFISHGKYEIVDEYTIHVTELPIGLWTNDYDNFLRSIMITTKKDADAKSDTKHKQIIDDYVIGAKGNNSVDITISFSGHTLQNLIKSNTLEQKLKLCSSISVANMYLHSENGVITKYDTAEDILSDFYTFRLRLYKQRKEYYTKLLKNELDILKYKTKFIQEIVDRTIIIGNKKKQIIIDELIAKKYPKLSQDINAIDSDEDVNDANETDEHIATKKVFKTYDYITNLQLFSLTREKIDELKKQRDMKNAELEKYEQTSAKDLWKAELHELSEFYDTWEQENIESLYTDPIDGTGKVKKPKTRKQKK